MQTLDNSIVDLIKSGIGQRFAVNGSFECGLTKEFCSTEKDPNGPFSVSSAPVSVNGDEGKISIFFHDDVGTSCSLLLPDGASVNVTRLELMVRTTDKYAFFFREWPSNFRKTRFSWTEFGETREFLCTEQAFMWAKAKYFGDEHAAADILENGDDPMYCKMRGREVAGYDDARWEAVRYGYMLKPNFERFSQDKELNALLTDPKYDGLEFVEASPYDRIWGIGLAQDDPAIDDKINWKGRNLLGQVITEVRKRILSA